TDADLGQIDLVLLGIKTWGEERHRRLTGKGIGRTLDFARPLAALRLPIWVRFVLVPGLTDEPEIASGIAAFAKGLGNVERGDVLPFHQMARYKWERLGLNYSLHDTPPPSPELVESTCRIFRDAGLKA